MARCCHYLPFFAPIGFVLLDVEYMVVSASSLAN